MERQARQEEVRRLYTHEGITNLAEIARRVGCSAVTVSADLVAFGLREVGGTRTNDDIDTRRIKAAELRDEGLTTAVIAKRLGISNFTALRDLRIMGYDTTHSADRKLRGMNVGGGRPKPKPTPVRASTMLTREIARKKGIDLRKLRLNPDVGSYANGYDHGVRDATRGAFLPKPGKSWKLSDVEAKAYKTGYLEGHGSVWNQSTEAAEPAKPEVRITRTTWAPELDEWENGFEHGWADGNADRYLPTAKPSKSLTSAEVKEYRAGYLEGHGCATWVPKDDAEVEKYAAAAVALFK